MGCPGTQWDVTEQPVKTRPTFHCQNNSYVRHKLVAYFSLLASMQKKSVGQQVFHMISSALVLKHKTQYLNILGQSQIIQPVSVVLDCLGHFVSI